MKPTATEDYSGMNASNAYQKLRSSQEFRRVYENGQRFYTPYFSAFILRTEGCQKRIGITVTRKVGKAVVRNRCKRRLREIARKYLRQAQSSNLSLVGYDLVINARSDLIQAEFHQIEESFARMMAKFHESQRERNGEPDEDACNIRSERARK